MSSSEFFVSLYCIFILIIGFLSGYEIGKGVKND